MMRVNFVKDIIMIKNTIRERAEDGMQRTSQKWFQMSEKKGMFKANEKKEEKI